MMRDELGDLADNLGLNTDLDTVSHPSWSDWVAEPVVGIALQVLAVHLSRMAGDRQARDPMFERLLSHRQRLHDRWHIQSRMASVECVGSC
jgi:hypothetical protein